MPELGNDKEESFTRNTISGTINRMLRDFGDDYFPPYRCCIFEPRFSFNNGDEQYSLICIYNLNVWGLQTNNFEETYDQFKTEVDNGVIKC
ncbi:MAG: hypothetical protein WDZ80_03615 [Candidatus Paceibacterota bacterium]